MKGREGNRSNQGKSDVAATTARGGYHGQAASRTLLFALCLESWFLSWIIHLGPIRLVLLALLTWFGLIFMLFS